MDPRTWLDGVTLAGLPPEWRDRSVLAYAAPSAVGDNLPPNVSITRDTRDAPGDDRSEKLAAYVTRQTRLLQKRLPGLSMLREAVLHDGPPPVQELLLQWHSGATAITQWLVWTDPGDGSVVCFTATARSSEFEAQQATFEGLLHQMKLEPRRFARQG
jgi:hypothetical protein